MDLVNAEHPVLLLRHRYDFDDSGQIYISTSYGHPGTWEEVRSISYRQAEWWQQSVDLKKWAGLSNIRIKFVLTDYLHEQNDWTIDSITISESPQALELYPPTNIQEHTITLNWSQSTDDDFARYSIFRSETNNSNYIMLTEITAQHSNFYTDTKVPKPNTSYYYKIVVESIHGIKNTSNEIHVTSTWGITNNAYPLTDTMEQGGSFWQ
jgi:Fibronectin type III domain.